MVSLILIITLSLPPLFFLFFLLSKLKTFLPNNLPPGPRGLPIIGNLHQLDTSEFSDHLWILSNRYGPLMSLRLGLIQTLVVSSADMAKEVLKTKDLVFCTRPVLTGQKKMSYNNKDVAGSPYSEYWREMRRICILHLFSLKQVNSFRSVREEEVFAMVDAIKTRILTKQQEVVNLSEMLMILTSNIISRVAFGKRPYVYGDEQQEVRRFQKLLLECQALLVNFYYGDYFPMMGWLDRLNGSIARLEKTFEHMDECYQEIIDEHLNPNRPNKMQQDMVDILLHLKQDNDSSIDLSFDNIKAVLMNILLGGTETSASAVVWAMTLLIKNPKKLKKTQQEVRNAIGNKGKVQECDLYKLNYLKAVMKETLRLYPVAPLLVARESREECVLDGYKIPKKTLVYVNAWAVGRDPKCWERPEEFEPERFVGTDIDYKGMHFGLIPFGSGRRGCPGMAMGAVTMELAFANIVYSLDWEVPKGVKDINTLTTPGTVSHKKDALQLVAKVYDDDGCKN